MNDSAPLITAMAEQCRARIHDSADLKPDLPQVLHPRHLLWMSERIIQNAEGWPDVRLHRWIGFIQCGMLANGIIDFEGAKALFDTVKNAYPGSRPDDDLVDHIDPDNSFGLDIGGEG